MIRFLRRLWCRVAGHRWAEVRLASSQGFLYRNSRCGNCNLWEREEL
jgi:hypothetical protein